MTKIVAYEPEHDSSPDAAAKPGRRGAPAKARARYFIALWVSETEEANGDVSLEILDEQIEAKSSDEALDKFKKSNGFEPLKLLTGEGNGLYFARGNNVKNNVAEYAVKLDPLNLQRRTTKSIRANFKGWSIVGSGIQSTKVDGVDYKDNDLFAITFIQKVDPKAGSKPQVRKFEVVKREYLEDIAMIP